MKHNTSEIEQILLQRQTTFKQMKSTLQESKVLIKKLKQAKLKLSTGQNSHVAFTSQSPQIEKLQSTEISPPLTDMSKNTTQVFKSVQKPKIDHIRQNIVGLCTRYFSPYNIELQTVYVDHTATNRAYTPVETMIKYTKRFMANPHTEFSYFGKFSTQMMHYSLNSLLKSFSADPEKYVVLPTGSGSTGAVQKAIRLIQKIQDPKNLPQIFITPYEHHSNILPWVQFYGGVTNLISDDRPVLQMEKIYDQIKNSPKKNIIVSVSAASNVTSQLTDMKSLNGIIKELKKIKNLIFAVDCAAYCCHHELNVVQLDQIDFAFISPHKNLGGAETCGLLLVNKSVISSSTPTFPGGGTVAMVKGYQHADILYDMDIFNRQVAGTPPFLGFYRAALSFELLKNDIGFDFIHEREKKNSKKFIDLLMEENIKFQQEGLKNSIIIYGNCEMENRANVFAINIINNGEMKNHHLISEILTDVFGIQVRSGCFCAGPFSMILLKLDKKMVENLIPVISIGIVKDKPGYIRMDLTFYLQDFEVEYIAKAISLTARYCNNMEAFYTICNDGEIKLNKMYQAKFPDLYDLKNYIELDEELKKMNDFDSERLKNRSQTLEKQLITGETIMKDPIKFFNNQKSLKK